MIRRGLFFLLLGWVVWAGPVAAQKPTPPPTPVPNAPSPPVAPSAAPTKAPEPPTPTPEPLPSVTPVPPSPTPQTDPPTHTPTATATTGALAAPTATPGVVPLTQSWQMATPAVTPTLSPTVTPTARPAPETPAFQWPALPGWVWPVGSGMGLLVLWLIVRFVGYTRQDLSMKRRMIAEDAAARLAAHQRDVAARLRDADAWWHILSQVATDALNTPVRITGDVLPQVDGDALAFTVVDPQSVRYCFTIASARRARQQGRVYRLDNPETQAEVFAVWHYLAAQWLHGTVPAVPRQATWVLIVQRPRSPLTRKRANRRWWLGVALCVALLIASSTFVAARLVQARLAPPTAAAAVTLVNATGETVSVWTLEEDPVCVVCPDTPLAPDETRAITVTPGSVLWEVVAVPFGDFYTAYRLNLVESYIPPSTTARDTVITLTTMPFPNGR